MAAASGPRPVDALVVVDMQAGLLTGASAIPDAARVTSAVRDLLARARAAGAFVVQLQNDGPPGSLDEPGSPGWPLHLPRGESGAPDLVIRKRLDDGFDGTGLEELLRSREVSSIAIGGVLSEMCVLATARAALARGFRVVLARDAHGTHDVPGFGDGAAPVPHHHVSRVAEWALGDEVELVNRARDVRFVRPGGGS